MNSEEGQVVIENFDFGLEVIKYIEKSEIIEIRDIFGNVESIVKRYFFYELDVDVCF